MKLKETRKVISVRFSEAERKNIGLAATIIDVTLSDLIRGAVARTVKAILRSRRSTESQK